MFRRIKVSSYIAPYPVFRIVQSALHFTLWQICSFQLLWEAFSHAKITAQKLHIHPPVSTARYSFLQLSELGQYGAKKFTRLRNSSNLIKILGDNLTCVTALMVYRPSQGGRSRAPSPNGCAPCHRRGTLIPGSLAFVFLHSSLLCRSMEKQEGLISF